MLKISGRERLSFGASLAIIILLSGCAGQQDRTLVANPPRSGVPSHSTPASAPEAASTTATAVDLNDPRSWIIDFQGIGPLALEDGISEAEPSMPAFRTTIPDACPWETTFTASGFPSIWIPDYSGAGVVEQIVLQGWGSPAAVAANSPRTRSGIGIGATLDELRAAYPGLSVEEGKHSTYYALPGDSGNWINFAVTDEGLVDTIVVRASSEMDSEYCG